MPRHEQRAHCKPMHQTGSTVVITKRAADHDASRTCGLSLSARKWQWRTHSRFVCSFHCLHAWSKLCDIHNCSRSRYRSSLKCNGLPRLKQHNKELH